MSDSSDLPLPIPEMNTVKTILPNNFSGGLKELVVQLLPLIMSALDNQNDAKSKRSTGCECKCAKQVQALQKNYERLSSSMSGYKAQVESWKDKVSVLQQAANERDREWKKEGKQIKTSATKIEQFTRTHEEMKKAVKALDAKKNQIDVKIDEIKTVMKSIPKTTIESTPKISDLEKSQEFINAEFEKLKEENTTLKGKLETQIQEVAQNLEYNMKKTNRNAQYTREECLTISGVPEEAIEGTDHPADSATAKARNNCKESKNAVIALCKELNLIVDPEKISIAHRLKKSRYAKKGPRPIIVKFSNKELCKDVYNLRKACKEISQWAFNDKANKIYINECLTPEKRKLLYETKQAVKNHLAPTHGIVYVWTHHGDIYMRKSADGAPRIRVNSSIDLQNILDGNTSLDVANDAQSAPNMIRWKYVKNPWATYNSSANFRQNYN